MDLSLGQQKARPALRARPITASLAVLSAWVALSTLAPLWREWRGDPALSHGPLVPLIAAALLWARRDRLARWDAACVPGLAVLGCSAALHVAAVWADIDFLEPLSAIAMAAGAVWFLGGGSALRAAGGALGFLVFMVPWPTTFTARLAFPMQLISSSYAALLAGLAGVPVQRTGVQLAVVPDAGGPPVYSVVVAQACSGLTSLIVLLALAYLVAYHTPVGWVGRAALFAAVVPMALLANSLRLAVILYAGSHHGPAVATWIHDHEGPVLMAFCSLGLVAARHALMGWSQRARREEGEVSCSDIAC